MCDGARPITTHYPCLTRRISVSLSGRTLIVLLERQNLILKKASTRSASPLSLFPFSSLPAHACTHTRNFGRRQVLESKQAFGWGSQIGAGWLPPILYLSRRCTSITHTPPPFPLPPSSNQTKRPPPPPPPPPFPPACTPPLLILQNKTAQPPKRNCIKLRK